MESLTSDLIALLALTAMEIVLGIDNIVFIVLLAGRLPEAEQPRARRLGLLAALGTRILLLLTINWVLKATFPLFTFSEATGLPAAFFVTWQAVNEISLRDLILLAGGLFLIAKSVHEIHRKIEGEEGAQGQREAASLVGVVVQIAIIDVVFSIDSVITAVGMADQIWVMVVAVMIAVGVMMAFADAISRFVEKHPTVKMLALSFLILIGVMLVAESLGTHFDKRYVYFAMAFALLVELLNQRMQQRRARKSTAA